MTLRTQTKHHNPESAEQNGEDPNETRRRNVDRMVRSVFQSFRERKLRRAAEQEQGKEEMDEVRLNIDRGSGKMDERDFAEKSDPGFRSKAVNREIGSPFFAH